ncbi:hypothetical protein [Nocardioides litoris]|uniref:hypothetical protein n=1 Tax=Nocardioides litoris TaxID=1926648 RepID=UPI0014771E6B|nr:hypothetical protein [Nocardioides litoris]
MPGTDVLGRQVPGLTPLVDALFIEGMQLGCTARRAEWRRSRPGLAAVAKHGRVRRGS